MLRAARLRIRALEMELAVNRRAAELLKESVRPKGASRVAVARGPLKFPI